MPTPERQKWFLKEWRKYRRLSQEELGARIGVSKGDISNWEKGKRRYNQDMLEKLARALALDNSGLLLMVDPNDPENMWSLWEHATPSQRQDIRRLAEVVVTKKAG